MSAPSDLAPSSFFASQKDVKYGVSDHTYGSLLRTVGDMLWEDSQASLSLEPHGYAQDDISGIDAIHRSTRFALAASISGTDRSPQDYLLMLNSHKDRARDFVRHTDLYDAYVGFCTSALQGSDTEEDFTRLEYELLQICASDRRVSQTIFVRTGTRAQQVDKLLRAAAGICDRAALAVHVHDAHLDSDNKQASIEVSRLEDNLVDFDSAFYGVMRMGRSEQPTDETIAGLQQLVTAAKDLRDTLTHMCEERGMPLNPDKGSSRRRCNVPSCGHEVKDRKSHWLQNLSAYGDDS